MFKLHDLDVFVFILSQQFVWWTHCWIITPHEKKLAWILLPASKETFGENVLVVNGYNKLTKYLSTRQWLVPVVPIIGLNLGILKISVWVFGNPFFYKIKSLRFKSHQIKLSFVDYTLLVMKTENSRDVHNSLETDHFLDLELSSDGITMELRFWKDANIGLYVNFTSFVPWTCHTWNLQSVS